MKSKPSRRFDPVTQRTLANLESILVTPAREYLFDPSIPHARISSIESSNLEPSEFHIPLLHPFAASVLDYLPARSLVLLDDLALTEAMVHEIEADCRSNCGKESVARPARLPADFPIPTSPEGELLDAVQAHLWVDMGYGGRAARRAKTAWCCAMSSGMTSVLAGGSNRSWSTWPVWRSREIPFWLPAVSASACRNCGANTWAGAAICLQAFSLWRLRFRKALFCAQPLQEGRMNAYRTTSRRANLPGSSLRPASFPAHDHYVHLITDSEIFGWERPAVRARHKQPAEAPEAAFGDLRAGDYVVHVDYGIGRFLGLVRRVLEGHEREFLAVEYEGGAQVFVPVFQADRLTRYVGADGAPTLTRLGTQEWANAKAGRQRSRAKGGRRIAGTLCPAPDRARTCLQPRYALAKGIGRQASHTWKPRPARSDCRHQARYGILPVRWTACCAAMWATAKPKWPCGRPSKPCRMASRWPC